MGWRRLWLLPVSIGHYGVFDTAVVRRSLVGLWRHSSDSACSGTVAVSCSGNKLILPHIP